MLYRPGLSSLGVFVLIAGCGDDGSSDKLVTVEPTLATIVDYDVDFGEQPVDVFFLDGQLWLRGL